MLLLKSSRYNIKYIVLFIFIIIILYLINCLYVNFNNYNLKNQYISNYIKYTNQIIHTSKDNKLLDRNENVNINYNLNDLNLIALTNPLSNHVQPTHKVPISILIINYNEEYLINTVHSLLNTSSSNYINEILIIDDMSPTAVTYHMFNPDSRIRIIRSNNRLGLIKARFIGGNLLKGPFMILLDAHVKPHDNWLEPIVKLLRENYKRLLNMEVGILVGRTWMQSEDDSYGKKAGFRYDLGHFWEPDRTKEELIALSGNSDLDDSPITMGMFATTKKWWNTIGGMDSGLEIWGGENIEISLRTWLCGGEIKLARGSQIDHVFRGGHPYKFDTKIFNKNRVRIAEAWLDDLNKYKFYKAINITKGYFEIGSIDDQQLLKKSLKCHPYSWYVNKFKGRTPVEVFPKFKHEPLKKKKS